MIFKIGEVTVSHTLCTSVVVDLKVSELYKLLHTISRKSPAYSYLVET